MTKLTLSRILTASTAAFLVAGCAVGPKAPDASFPPTASGAFITPQTTSDMASGAIDVASEARSDWWRLYADTTLDGLIQRAFVRNNDIKTAEANLRSARASLSESRAGRLPTTTTSASYSYGRQSAGSVNIPGVPTSTEPQDETETYDASLDVSYELDLYGRVSADIRAARADADAQAEALSVTRVSVAAETARAYADACSGNAQLAVAQRTLDLQTRTVDLTQRLLDGGAGTGLDTASARSSLASTRATLPTLRASRDEALFRLATLTGDTPAEASEAARQCTRAPQLSQPLPVGDGAALLARRPDVRQAERNLAAAAARVNVATASLYPKISLSGSVGTTALGSASKLGDDGALNFSIGPLISWSFPNIAVARAQIAQAGAKTDAALATFDGTVLTALQETETALTNYANELDRRAALTTARDEAAKAAELSRLRFQAGADSFLVVLDAERTLASADSSLATSDALVTTYQIALFKALAGGWAS